MLGIRTYQGRAIDLWCGRSEDFVADIDCLEIGAGYAQAAKSGARHLALRIATDPVPMAAQASEVYQKLKDCIDASPLPFPRRISVVVSQLSHYEVFEDAFYKVFTNSPGE